MYYIYTIRRLNETVKQDAQRRRLSETLRRRDGSPRRLDERRDLRSALDIRRAATREGCDAQLAPTWMAWATWAAWTAWAAWTYVSICVHLFICFYIFQLFQYVSIVFNMFRYIYIYIYIYMYVYVYIHILSKRVACSCLSLAVGPLHRWTINRPS